MVYDCFLYNGETDLLKIRLAEMNQLGDQVKHIAIEGTHTFTGIPKSFDGIRDHEKLSHFIYGGPISPSAWENETNTRNHIATIFSGFMMSDTDTIIISDVDEIPRAQKILNYSPDFGMCALQMDVYYYYLNALEAKRSWYHPRIMPWSYLKDKQPDQVRRSGYDLALVDAGWHFTSQGGIKAVQEKFRSFSHQEPEIQSINLQEKIDSLESIWGNKLSVVPIDDSFPMYVQENQELLKNMIKI